VGTNDVVEDFESREALFCLDLKFRSYYGSEFQPQFYWHLEALDMWHIYIRPRTAHLNGKVERSHQGQDPTGLGVCVTIAAHTRHMPTKIISLAAKRFWRSCAKM
jgi:hypothetical protein